MNGRGGTDWNRDALIGFVSLFVIAVLVFLGSSLTRANSDYVCNDNSIQNQEQGECTNGSWGPWIDVGNDIQQRTYTGTQSIVAFAGGNIVSCSHPSDSIGTSGTITTTYAVCQIIQTKPQTASGGGTSGSNSNSNGTGTNGSGSTTETVTIGATVNSSQTTGSYSYYQEYTDSLLATGTISAVPSIVKVGATTQISWSASHVSSCVVMGSNADSWTGLQSPVDGETSGPINQPTTYTLDCTTAIGTHIEETTIVNLLPTFQEQ